MGDVVRYLDSARVRANRDSIVCVCVADINAPFAVQSDGSARAVDHAEANSISEQHSLAAERSVLHDIIERSGNIGERTRTTIVPTPRQPIVMSGSRVAASE
jgi:hypothetical protein